MNCYGPQENISLEVRTEFFIELETRIISAKTNGKMICIEFDPNEMSSNGTILSEMLARQNMIVVNTKDKAVSHDTQVIISVARVHNSYKQECV